MRVCPDIATRSGDQSLPDDPGGALATRPCRPPPDRPGTPHDHPRAGTTVAGSTDMALRGRSHKYSIEARHTAGEARGEGGKARSDQFLGGIDGELDAVAEIKKGGPYKASVSLASPVFGYALGHYGADWLDGKSVPQAMDILPHALDAGNIAEYEADVSDPAAVLADTTRRTKYLRMYGNICYDSRSDFVNFPWSSERR